MTHPESREVGAVLSKVVTPKKGDVLYLNVANHESGNQLGDFVLQIKANGKVLKEAVVSKDTVGADGWLWVEIPLDAYAGTATLLEIVNQPNGWSWEAAYFSTIGIEKPNMCEAP